MTEIQSFDNIEAAKVAVKSEKLYVDREGGFIGTSLKKEEYVETYRTSTTLLYFCVMADK